MSARINILPANEAAVQLLSDKLHLPRFIASTLVARGIDTPEKAELFLSPDINRDWRNPYDIGGMDSVVDALSVALRAQKRILVFGDFDLDGISATAIMTRGLRALGAEVIPFIPLRFEEGYGLSDKAIERLMKYEPNVVVTVDNGIAAKNEVQKLKSIGVEVIITDHHEPSGLVPEGIPVLDPKCGNSPSSILSGAGVALKVIQALGGCFGQPHYWRELIDLATLGTVADLMPMVDENRALVDAGVRMINEHPRTCILALLAESGYSDKPTSASNLSFTLVPRLNAAGRMGNAQLALDLLMSDDYVEATRLAHELELTNTRRREIEAELAEFALKQAEAMYHGERVLLVSGEGWHEGVKGIVASRLVNKFGVPAILFTIDGDEARGSGRSVGEINLFKAIESCEDLLTRFGGHGAAVGVTLPSANLDAFFERLCSYMDSLPAESFFPRIKVDAVVELDELTRQNVEKLEVLAPFGQENATPKFLAHSVVMSYSRAVGVDKNHLACTFTDGRHTLDGIMFHCPDVKALQSCSTVVDVVFELQIDSWKGRKTVKAIISSLTPVRPCSALEACLEPESQEFVSRLLGSNRQEFAARIPCVGFENEPHTDQRSYWRDLACHNPRALREKLLEAFIGNRSLHASQQQILDLLDEGKSVLGVLGTGRGKSLTFHIYAVEQALKNNKVSLFLYPLRALIADQAFHLQKTLAPFGIEVSVLTGETDHQHRDEVMNALSKGLVDIVLTTPEYLEAHSREFASTNKVSFLVVDEAHHVATSRAGYRMVYTQIAKLLEVLNMPQVLALTATADDAIAKTIKEHLFIDQCVFDNARRGNLLIDDQRGIRHRDRYLLNLLSKGEKTIVYVNSRMESVVLTRMLRRQLPHMAPLIGFYNAGLTREERMRVESFFRDDTLQVLVATSAFGEGIDIPHVRHVVLYHLPFSEVEFNQMSGRAGRDGNEARVHLLFGNDDGALNLSLLHDATPNHDDMAQIYRHLRALQRLQQEHYFSTTFHDLAQGATRAMPLFAISSVQAACGVTVFKELGLIQVKSHTLGYTDEHMIHVVDYKGKVELTQSVRYCEGLREIELFNTFKDWVLSESADVLQNHIQKPMLPRYI